MEQDTNWVEVYRTGDDFQMEFVRGLLTTSGLKVVVKRKGAKDMPTIMGVASYGEYILTVHPDEADLAKALIEAPVEEEAAETEE